MMEANLELRKDSRSGHLPSPNIAPSAKHYSNVTELQYLFQEEWQLWAKVMENFSDDAHHKAYISKQAAIHALPTAAYRYSEYLRLMAPAGVETPARAKALGWLNEIAKIQTSLFIQQEAHYTKKVIPQSLLDISPRLGKSLWFGLGFYLIWVFIL